MWIFAAWCGVWPLLMLSAQPPWDSCWGDVHEPNGRRSAATPVVGERIAGTVCPGDSDWYVVDVSGRALTVEFVADGDLKASVFAPRRRRPTTALRSGQARHLRAWVPGRYKIRVRGTGAGTGGYQLRVRHTQAR